MSDVPNASAVRTRRRSAAASVDFAPLNVEFATFAQPGSCLAVWLVSGNSFWHSFTERPNRVLGARDRVCFLSAWKRENEWERERKRSTKFVRTCWCMPHICGCVRVCAVRDSDGLSVCDVL